MGEKLTVQEILDAGLDDWRLLLNALYARFTAKDFATVLALANAVGEVAEEMNHHPDLDLRWGLLNVRTFSHDVGAVTGRDIRLARRISQLAAEAGAEPRPQDVQLIELALDTPDYARVKPFWRAVLGMSDNPEQDEEVRDAKGSLPNLWFQKTEPHETPRQRFHVDIHVPHDVAEQRIAAALEAGGTLVSDADAPSFTILADEDGNKACVCTWQSAGSSA